MNLMNRHAGNTHKWFAAAVSLVFLVAAAPLNTIAQGNETNNPAPVTLVEYSDYQCPACAYFHPIVEKLKDHFGDQLKVEYRYYPLNSHQYAALAARAAQAAKNQGKFLEMHSMLFENQERWASSGNPQAIFTDYARKLELDLDQFKSDLNSGETQRIVMEEREEGRQKGVGATPTFFINGEKMMQLPQSYQEFKALVEIYLEEAQQGDK